MKERKKPAEAEVGGDVSRFDKVEVGADGTSDEKARAAETGEKAKVDDKKAQVDSEKTKRSAQPERKMQKSGLVMLIVGLVVLVAGLAWMLVKLPHGAGLRDAEYLVEVGTWVREDAPGVVWEFTEVGNGRLTTNDGLNTYDFIWALEGSELRIETDWLYTLGDSYIYQLDQGTERLVLNDTMVFRPAE